MSKVVTFGEIMLRLVPQGFLRFSQANNFNVIYGGGESNIAVLLANYGVSVDFITRFVYQKMILGNVLSWKCVKEA